MPSRVSADSRCCAALRAILPRMMSRSVPVLVFLIACGGSNNEGGGDVTKFVGVYATTSHTRAEMPGGSVSCNDAGQPVTGGMPYFRIAVDAFFMDPDVVSISN